MRQWVNSNEVWNVRMELVFPGHLISRHQKKPLQLLVFRARLSPCLTPRFDG